MADLCMHACAPRTVSEERCASLLRLLVSCSYPCACMPVPHCNPLSSSTPGHKPMAAHCSMQHLRGGSALAGVAAGLLLKPLCTPCCSVKDICEYVYANDAAVRQFGELRTAEGSQAMIRQLSEAERENRRRFSIAVMQVWLPLQHGGSSAPLYLLWKAPA